jgi:hypothetical protein
MRLVTIGPADVPQRCEYRPAQKLSARNPFEEQAAVHSGQNRSVLEIAVWSGNLLPDPD